MYYAGLDAHVRYLRIAVLDKDGNLVLETTVPCEDPERLVRELAPYRPLSVVVETSPSWPWIHDLLVAEGIDFRLAHAKHLRMIAHSAQKNDTVDARLLARMLLAGLIPEAYPRVGPQRDLLRLVRHHAWLVRNRTVLVNRIHAQLHERRLLLEREKLLRREGREWLKTVAWPRLTPEQQQILATHLELIEVLDGQIRAIRRRVVRTARQVPEAALLGSVPGIGPYWGILLAAELLPIGRFPNAKKFISYAGLAPTTRSSGGHTSHGPIPKGANRWVRNALVSATATHVQRAPDSPVTRHYQELKARLGWRKARVAAARKLARAVYRMLQMGELWRDKEKQIPADRVEPRHRHVAETTCAQ
jgi:transposase